MNLFLLIVVPVMTFVVCYQYFEKTSLKTLAPTLALSGISTLVLALVFGWFEGLWPSTWHFWGSFWHYFMSEYVFFLVPVLLLFYWKGVKGRSRSEFILTATVLIGLLFTVLGFRDFIATRPHFDDIDLFMLPILRVYLVMIIPLLFLEFLEARGWQSKVLEVCKFLALIFLMSALVSFKVLGYHLWVWGAVLILGAGVVFWTRHEYKKLA